MTPALSLGIRFITEIGQVPGAAAAAAAACGIVGAR
jgi:hypothetical protein